MGVERLSHSDSEILEVMSSCFPELGHTRGRKKCSIFEYHGSTLVDEDVVGPSLER